MTITSFYLIGKAGDVLIEKHHRSPLPRSVLDPLQEEITKASRHEDVPSVVSGPKHYLINILRENIFYVGVCPSEVPPLFVIELLRRIVSIFENYLGTAPKEKLVRREAVLLYQLLEEVVDNGFPLTTEPNVLEALIMKPTVLNMALRGVGRKKTVEDTLPSGQLSATHWRKSNVKYSTNECFIDVEEHVSAIVSRSGNPVTASAKGKVICRCHLSGMPDCTLSFADGGRCLDDISLHPCVRIARWQNERIMSFIPPDGKFELAGYRVYNVPTLPFNIRGMVNYKQAGGGRIEIDISPKGAVVCDNVELAVEFPKAVNGVTVNTSFGNWSFEELTKTLRWTIRKLPERETQTLRGSVSLAVSEAIPDGNPTIQANFRVQGATASGLKVKELIIYNEKYRAYKGVKYVSMADDYQVRM
ncbi:hypothetical protein PTSG_03775 [Salpingoeca rosetta]|uniref:MHD domain-containing protein n=1 Tax=Salpingoeca rosetta (strain ATCC 50818 / BSB-021) TaxID=946362 RepID=F2U5C3_SALR5|nr:uncharacterized protein PTSG_03775 [Salpingoeca rosetta]EGD83139.1 hypothetical protein PTSG_03775 [Salpingoeca rosetta]|eukprot:XP_004995503.1 hypothetical protein PTSG_03775 [Salpingoeca rosetta]